MGNQVINASMEKNIEILRGRATKYFKETTTIKAEFTEEFLNHFIDTDLLQKSLELRQNNVDAAFEFYKVMIDYLTMVRPDTFKIEEITEILNSKICYIHGKDKEGRLCILNFTANHIADRFTIETTFKYQWYCSMELEKRLNEGKHKKCVCISDMRGLGWKNWDSKMLWYKKIIQCTQELFEDKLEAIYVINAGFLFDWMWYLCKPFMSQKTLDRTQVFRGHNELKNFITEDNLLAEHGGTSKFDFKFEINNSIFDTLSEKFEVKSEEKSEFLDK